MKGKIILTILFVFGLWPFIAMAQSTDPCHYSTEGKDFWFGIMENRTTGADHYLEITVTSRIGAQVTITYGPGEVLLWNETIAANTSFMFSIDYNLLEPKGSEKIENKGIHLVATNPVNVYALNYRTRSSDVAVIYPTESLGKEYFAMCYSPHISGTTETNSEFMIAAKEDNTTVNITPSVDTDQGKKANTKFTIQLNKGQTYQVQSMNTSVSGQGDLSGSFISSNKGIAFFSGAKATSVPITGSSYDFLYEQIPPISTWGKEFYVVPLKLRNKDIYRVLAAEDGTVVTVEGNNTTRTLNRGQYFEFELSSSQASRIIANKRVLLAQFCGSQNSDGSGVGDPFMVVLSPVVQKINDVTFVAYESALIQSIFYVNIIIRTSEVGNITLDNSDISQYFRPFPVDGYSYAQVPISKGAHSLKNPNKEGGFLAFVYGFGDNNNTESYGYGVGYNLDIQLDIGLNYDLKDTLVICQGQSQKLDAGTYFNKYLWNTGDTLASIMVSKEGMYTIAASTLSGCKKTDSLYVKVNDPTIYLGKDTSSCGPGKIVLDAGKNFNTYQWQDGSVKQTFMVNKTGKYIVSGINQFGCEAKDTIEVTIFDVPNVKITGDTLHCGDFTGDLKVKVTNADPSIWNYAGAANWSATPEGLEFTNEGPEGVKLTAVKPGYYTVKYVLTTKNSCAAIDSFHVGFYNTPESTFEVYSPESTDKCSSYKRIVKLTGNNGPTAKYKWDFGGLMLLDTISENQFNISIGANNRSRTIKLVVEEHGCTSPLTSMNIGVDPNFNYKADNVHGCDSMCVQFNSEVMISDTVTYQWTFGDGAISNLQNPMHCYRDTGKYDVSLLVTNVIDGCRNGSTEPKMIKIYKTPVAKFSADPSICYGDTVIFKYLNKKDFSNCEWITNGNELISNQNTSATYLLKNEISEVGFIVEENGCKSDTLKVEVKRKPNFDFDAVETEICLPIPVRLLADPKDPDLQFSWSVDSLSQVKGDSLVHLFSKPGLYSVTLQAFSKLTGCSDQITKTNYIQIYPLPDPLFNKNYKIATIEHPDISFTNKTQGAVSYLWNFGDGETSIDESPSHHYNSIGRYKVLLFATTDFGCVDTISSPLKIIPFTFYTPNAFRPDSNIPENQVFLPIQEGIDPDNYQFRVFNRVGSTVFETRNAELGWDGKMPNGTAASPGIFVWIVKFIDVQGYDHQQKGTVMLVR
jgi:PKD repeat protein